MKKTIKSYNILHDFLFDVDEFDIKKPAPTHNKEIKSINLSNIIKCTTYESLSSLIGAVDTFIINDDINQLTNPESIRFKEFFISCVVKKFNNITIYTQ